MSWPEAVVAQIEAERAARRMTQAQLAQASGIALRTLSRYLDSEREIKLGQLPAIADALGIDLVTLLQRASERQE